MTKTLYNDIEHMKYIALAEDAVVFHNWCSRRQVDKNEIILITTAYAGIEKKIAAIYHLDDYGLILLEGWKTVRDTHSGWSKRLFDSAKYILDTAIVRPDTAAGYIINWKLIGKQEGRKPPRERTRVWREKEQVG